MTATNTGRWVYGDVRTYYSWPQCNYCGRAQSHDCRPVECLACGTRQCHGNGSGNGCCNVCHYGWLPGWSRSGHRQCGYRDCSNLAVANAPRVKRVCAQHLDRVKHRFGGRTQTLAEHIAERIAHRNSGKGWQQFRWVD